LNLHDKSDAPLLGASFLKYYQASSFALGVPFVAFFVYAQAPMSSLGPAIFLAFVVVSLILSRENSCKAASVLLVGSLWAAPTWCINFTGGINSPLLIWLAPPAFMAGVLLGWRWALGIGLLSISSVLGSIFFAQTLQLSNEIVDTNLIDILLVLSVASAILYLTFYGYFYAQSMAAATRELQLEVAERYQAQRALKASEEHHRMVVETAPDGIITMGEDCLVRSFNTAAEGIFGYRAEEAIGRNVSFLMPDDIATRHDDLVHRYLRTGEARIVGRAREVQGRRKSGELVTLDLAVSETKTPDGRTFMGLLRDISERKLAETTLQNTLDELRQTQESLIQAEKLASLGGLVAGVAHEINTPVGIGVTAASHLQEKVRHLDQQFGDGTVRRSDLEGFLKTAAESTEIVLNNLARASGLIRSFKQVAVDQSSEECRRFTLRAYLDEVVTSLRPQLKQTAHQVSIDCDPGMEIETFPGAVSQVVTNLVINSLVHAYDDGDVGVMRITARRSGDSIVLTYEDNGKGIPADQLPKIFDPFYTTRRGQGGSGLGLNIVYNLVTQKLGGVVTCDSEPGVGTRFEISFPVTARIAA
jgi:PAS domain S-box-containing protein